MIKPQMLHRALVLLVLACFSAHTAAAQPKTADPAMVRNHNALVNDSFPIYLKFHKVGSETVAGLLRSAFRKRKAHVAYVCGAGGGGVYGDIFGHQTLPVYSDASLPTTDAYVRRCLPGMNVRVPKFVAVFRNPVARFVSGVYYYESKTRDSLEAILDPALVTPWDLVKGLFKATVEPARADLLTDPKVYARVAGGGEPARAQLPTDSKVYAPVRGGFDGFEYTNVMSKLLGTDRRARLEASKLNAARDLSVVGVTEELDAFFALCSLAFKWPDFPCLQTSSKNVRGARGPNDAAMRRTVVHTDLNTDTRSFLEHFLATEIEFYDFIVDLHARQRLQFEPELTEHLNQHRTRCENNPRSPNPITNQAWDLVHTATTATNADEQPRRRRRRLARLEQSAS